MSAGITSGEGYAIASLDAIGEGYGFRKVRKALDIKSMGANAIVMPPGYSAGAHAHEKQEEIYLCLSGTLRLEFGDGTSHDLSPGTIARVDAPTVRQMSNPGEDDLTYICFGAADGYVGRDGIEAEL